MKDTFGEIFLGIIKTISKRDCNSNIVKEINKLYYIKKRFGGRILWKYDFLIGQMV